MQKIKDLFKKLFRFFWDKSLLIFLIIGAGNTIISMAGSQLLLRPISNALGDTAGYWLSTAIMYLVCSVVSFVLNRRFSFESKAPLGQSVLRFTVVIGVCYLVSFGLSKFLVPAFMGAAFPSVSAEWVTRIAMLVAQVIFTLMNYLGQRLWAFKE